MKAYFVDDITYSVDETTVDPTFVFKGQYKYFENEATAREELLKVIQADMGNLEELIKQETEKLEKDVKKD